MTLEEIGEKFDLTRERVRQIKEKAIRRLRHSSRSKLLKSYLGPGNRAVRKNPRHLLLQGRGFYLRAGRVSDRVLPPRSGGIRWRGRS